MNSSAYDGLFRDEKIIFKTFVRLNFLENISENCLRII